MAQPRELYEKLTHLLFGDKHTADEVREAIWDELVQNIDLNSVTGAMIEDDAIDSRHYVDGSIDNAHLAANSVDSDNYVDGSIDNAHLAANSVDSDQYVDGSIDPAHLANNAVETAAIADGNVTNAKLGKPKLTTYQETLPVASFTDNADTTGQIDLNTTIPAGAVFERAMVHNLVGFAGDSSATAQLGDGTDVDRYNTGTPDFFTTAAEGVDMGDPSGTKFHAAAATPRLTITTATDFTAAVTEGNGTVDVTLFYYEVV